jgi:hypothetical protein
MTSDDGDGECYRRAERAGQLRLPGVLPPLPSPIDLTPDVLRFQAELGRKVRAVAIIGGLRRSGMAVDVFS